MVREPIIKRGKPDSDGRTATGFDRDGERYDEELRPQRLADVVGQRKVVERLQIMLNAAQKRNEPLGHLLLDGPPGIGKTTLAVACWPRCGSSPDCTSFC